MTKYELKWPVLYFSQISLRSQMAMTKIGQGQSCQAHDPIQMGLQYYLPRSTDDSGVRKWKEV